MTIFLRVWHDNWSHPMCDSAVVGLWCSFIFFIYCPTNHNKACSLVNESIIHRGMKRNICIELTHSEFEVIEGMLVDDVQLPHQSKRKLHHGPYVHVLPIVFLVGTTHTVTLEQVSSSNGLIGPCVHWGPDVVVGEVRCFGAFLLQPEMMSPPRTGTQRHVGGLCIWIWSLSQSTPYLPTSPCLPPP